MLTWKQHGKKITLLILISVDDKIYNPTDEYTIKLSKRKIIDFRNTSSDTTYDKAIESLILALNHRIE